MRLILSGITQLLVLCFQSVLLALSQIRSNKVRSALTTIGIVIGVSSVAAVIGSLAGLKTKVLGEFNSFGIQKIWCYPERPEKGPLQYMSWQRLRFLPEQFEGVLDRCPSLKTFTFTTYERRKVSFGAETMDNVQVCGVNASWLEIDNRKIALGRPFTVIDEQQGWSVCLITKEVQRKLQLDRDCQNQIIQVDNRSFRIVGVVEDRVSAFDQGEAPAEVYIPFTTVWKLWKPELNASFMTRDAALTEEALAELRFFLRQTRRLRPEDPDTFRIGSVEQELESFNKVAGVMTAVAGGIVGISLLVGGVGIMNIMLVSVSERTREIGLRKAVGARPSAIMMQFLVEAIVLCLLGGVVGLAFGQLLCYGIAQIPNANLDETHIPLWAVNLSFGFCAFVGVFFGLFPAVKAARMDPINALRHE